MHADTATLTLPAQTCLSPAQRATLPSMYDLPSEDPEESGLPDEFHAYQPQLLRDTFQPSHYAMARVFVATDLNLYYDVQHTGWHKRPDWFAVLGVSRFYDERDLRLSYVIWQEQVVPYLVVELLSPGTEDEDLGRTPPPRTTDEPPTKWMVYEQILAIPYYVVYSRYTNTVQYFVLQQGRYQAVLPPDQRLWLPEAGLGLGLWSGVYQGLERQWLRCYDAQGAWIPTPAERTAQAQLQAEQAQLRAEQAQLQAEQAQLRATRLAAQLRALGIEPEA